MDSKPVWISDGWKPSGLTRLDLCDGTSLQLWDLEEHLDHQNWGSVWTQNGRTFWRLVEFLINQITVFKEKCFWIKTLFKVFLSSAEMFFSWEFNQRPTRRFLEYFSVPVQKVSELSSAHLYGHMAVVRQTGDQRLMTFWLSWWPQLNTNASLWPQTCVTLVLSSAL